MATIVRTETRKRGFIGKLFLVLFWGFNAIMALALFRGLTSSARRLAEASTEAQQAGTAVGAAIGTGMILVIWAAGAVILGLVLLITPGKTVITETTRD